MNLLGVMLKKLQTKNTPVVKDPFSVAKNKITQDIAKLSGQLESLDGTTQDDVFLAMLLECEKLQSHVFPVIHEYEKNADKTVEDQIEQLQKMINDFAEKVAFKRRQVTGESIMGDDLPKIAP